MIARLVPLFAEKSGPVLEIGCGSGQHAGAFSIAFPHLDWWPSDLHQAHLDSADAWRAHLRLPERAALSLDATMDWAMSPAVSAIGPLQAVVSMNVIHIAPFAVAEGIISGAAKALARGGLLIFYGPFKEGGAHTADSNADFDVRLRDENPDWGIRDVDDLTALADDAGLDFLSLQEMPANNRLLVFTKA
jgi:SAM-dependent methyltransferase